MAAARLKLYSRLIGYSRHLHNVTRRATHRVSRASRADHMTRYEWDEFNVVVGGAAQKLLAREELAAQQYRFDDDDYDGDKDQTCEATLHTASLRYKSSQHDITGATSPNGWIPSLSCSGFLPDGVARPCVAACMPATAWSSRPQSPLDSAKSQQDPGSCPLMRYLSCQMDNSANTTTRLPVLCSRSNTRYSLAKDETPTRSRHFRPGDSDRAGKRRLPYGYQPGQLRALSDASLPNAINLGLRGLSYSRRQLFDLPFIETRQLLCSLEQEKTSQTEDTFAIQLVEDCNAQTDGSADDNGPGKSWSDSQAEARRSVALLPGIVNRPFIVRSPHAKFQHLNEKCASSRTKQLRSLMDRSMSSTQYSP